MQISILVAAL